MSAAIRSDNGGEFTGNKIEEILCENDIHHYEIRPSIAKWNHFKYNLEKQQF